MRQKKLGGRVARVLKRGEKGEKKSLKATPKGNPRNPQG
jgi:hypothetical protein